MSDGRDTTLRGVAPAIAVATGPLLVGAGALLRFRHSFSTFADLAVTEITVRDVGRHAVLLGPYSRFGWHHPGPSLFWLLALPYNLVGQTGVALAVGAALVNAVSASVIVLVAARRGGRLLAWWAAAGTAVYIARLGSNVLRDPWNPLVTILPFCATMMLVWAVSCGDRLAWPAALGFGSFVVQSHIGYAPPVAAAFLAVVVLLLIERRARRPAPVSTGTDTEPAVGAAAHTKRETELTLVGSVPADGTARRVLVLSVLVLAAFWCAPLWQEIATRPGNLTEIVRYFGAHSSSHPWPTSAGIVLHELGLPATRLRDTQGGSTLASAAVSVTGIIAIATAIVALVLSARRPRPDAFRLGVLTLLLGLVAVEAVTRVSGDVYSYLALWVSGLTLLVWIALGASLGTSLRASTVKRRPIGYGRIGAARGGDRTGLLDGIRVGAALCVSVAVVVGVANTYDAARAPAPEARASHVGRTVTDAVRDALAGDTPGPVYVRILDHDAWVAAPSVVLAAERAGRTVHIPPEWGFLIGSRFVSRGPASETVSLTLAGSAQDRMIAAQGSTREVTSVRTPYFPTPVRLYLTTTPVTLVTPSGT